MTASCGPANKDRSTSWADMPAWAKGSGEYSEDGGLPSQDPGSAQEAPVEKEPKLVESPWVLRADLDRVLDAGVALFLQRVPLEVYRPDGVYKGFRIVSIDGQKSTSRLNIMAGDIVTLVNGQSIERPEYLSRIWKELRVASEIRIEYLRDNEKIIETIQVMDE